MNWLNIQTSTLHAREYMGASPVARATWWNVLLWCCTEENGGRIIRATGFKDRQWQQLCGVTLREVNHAAPLLTWEGDDLIVWRYPIEKQPDVARRREIARQAGTLGGRPRLIDGPVIDGEKQPSIESSMEPSMVSSIESGKRKEGEKKENIEHRAGKPAPAREPDECFEALCRAGGDDPSALTRSGARSVAVALADIRRTSPAVTPDEIHARASRFRQVMPAGCRCTAHALAKHWAKCGERQPRNHAAPIEQSEPEGWREVAKVIAHRTEDEELRERRLEAAHESAWVSIGGAFREQILKELREHRSAA